MQQKKEGITMKYSNYKNPYTKNGKIYSSSDIYNMKLGEAYSRKKELFAQKRSIGIPTDSELAQSDNVVWVNEYTRSDGTHVRGHWRAKPGQGQTNPISQESWNENLSQEQTQEDELSEIDLDNPAQTAATATLKLLGVFLDGTEIGEILYILTPLIQFIINKWLGEDDSEIAEFDYSKENDEQIPWENAQPFKPDENPFLAEPEKQKGEEKTKETDSLTGGASSVEGILINQNQIDSVPDPTDETNGIAGVIKGKPMSYEEAGGNKVNPNYNSGDERYKKNCQACIGVFEARLRGYDIEALPYDKETHQFLEYYPEYLFINPDTKLVDSFTKLDTYNNADSQKWLNENVQIGERYMLRFMPTNNKNIAHIVSVYKDENGELVFNDVMTGNIYGKEFIKTWKYTVGKGKYQQKYSPSVLRTDNKLLNISKLNKIAKARVY